MQFVCSVSSVSGQGKYCSASMLKAGIFGPRCLSRMEPQRPIYKDKIHRRLMAEETTDGELITRYIKDGDQSAFEILLRRHHDRVFWRFLKRCGNRADAEDLTQQLWIRVVDNLDNYSDQDKFGPFLATIGTNLLNDHWRRKGVRSAAFVDWNDDEEDMPRLDPASREGSAEDQVLRGEAINHLVSNLIPSLPAEQRMIYLLRHESEHWEESSRLEWSHLAELNGMSVDEAWSKFESARHSLMGMANNDEAEQPDSPDNDELLMFLVWTQAQRPNKEQKYTESYFADLIGVPVNTLKTRYRAASKSLADGLEQWREHH